ncbi:hypothetical protein [Rhizobium rhizogenes]|uniref:hypothetical protein n=1 Tax=Rhizobium rhizogenes TaxID=359 RepID=UPI000648EDE3|nr:hypothetical protein [Rhizobium rhizogenes]
MTNKRYLDGSEKKYPEKNDPYVIDEISKKSIYVYLGSYFVGAFLFFSFVEPPYWLILLIVGGFGYLYAALFWQKIVLSSYVKPKNNEARFNGSSGVGDED